jgi:hypothetical protein
MVAFFRDYSGLTKVAFSKLVAAGQESLAGQPEAVQVEQDTETDVRAIRA